ncbi:Uncharacterised protein [Mycobacteroides abscessus subsp. abscessus]|nr:Uncharacterised protein [Mycobacteroides abscessus subsp. abscessus]
MFSGCTRFSPKTLTLFLTMQTQMLQEVLYVSEEVHSKSTLVVYMKVY